MKVYKKEIIIKDLNFYIDQEEFFVIVGPNGSGKTTLIKLLARLDTLNNGEIQIMGLYLHEYSRKKLARILAYVPQKISTEFPFTVLEFVSMGRSPHLGILGIKTKQDIKIIDNSMQITEIEKLADKMIWQLSGGELQRVFIAKAICQEAKLIILDEPTSALDIEHQIKIMDLMEKLISEKKITVVMVLHDINLAALYSTRILLIKSGNLVKIGTPSEIINSKFIEETYNCQIIVDNSPFNKIPRITPIPSKFKTVNL